MTFSTKISVTSNVFLAEAESTAGEVSEGVGFVVRTMFKRSIISCSFVLLVVIVVAGEGASNKTNALLLPLEEAPSSVEPVAAHCEGAGCVIECLQ